MSRHIAAAFFKDDRGKWHAPGDILDGLTEDELRTRESAGQITIVRTQMVKPPEKRPRAGRPRIGKGRKNESD